MDIELYPADTIAVPIGPTCGFPTDFKYENPSMEVCFEEQLLLNYDDYLDKRDHLKS